MPHWPWGPAPSLPSPWPSSRRWRHSSGPTEQQHTANTTPACNFEGGSSNWGPRGPHFSKRSKLIACFAASTRVPRLAFAAGIGEVVITASSPGGDADGRQAVTSPRATCSSQPSCMEPCRRTAAVALAASVLLAQLVAISCTGRTRACCRAAGQLSACSAARVASNWCSSGTEELLSGLHSCHCGSAGLLQDYEQHAAFLADCSQDKGSVFGPNRSPNISAAAAAAASETWCCQPAQHCGF